MKKQPKFFLISDLTIPPCISSLDVHEEQPLGSLVNLHRPTHAMPESESSLLSACLECDLCVCTSTWSQSHTYAPSWLHSTPLSNIIWHRTVQGDPGDLQEVSPLFPGAPPHTLWSTSLPDLPRFVTLNRFSTDSSYFKVSHTVLGRGVVPRGCKSLWNKSSWRMSKRKTSPWTPHPSCFFMEKRGNPPDGAT